MQLPPRLRRARAAAVVIGASVLVASCGGGGDVQAGGGDGGAEGAENGAPVSTAAPIDVVPGMPPVVDPTNLYSETGPNMLADTVKGDAFRVYVPNERSGTVTVIDPTTYEVIDTYATGAIPQHVVPAWDLETLYALNNSGNSLTPIDPATGEDGKNIPIEDPYNLYFTPDGQHAIIVQEALERLMFVDPHTFEETDDVMQLECAGLNHIDFSIDGKYLVATCEFEGAAVKVDWVNRTVLDKLVLDDANVVEGGYQNLPMPQDVRVSPDGSTFYFADMISDGVHIVDAATFTEKAFLKTGRGAHGLYPSRDGKQLYVINRGANTFDVPSGPGGITIIDFATNEIVEQHPIPGGGSPDMGNFTPDGGELWLGGRYDHVVYVFDTQSKEFTHQIEVGRGPHGLTVWPQPGRYSLGHTGNMR